jgi:hypothetical protein
MPTTEEILARVRTTGIRVAGKDGTLIYKGRIAKTLRYAGRKYKDYLLFAEPQIVGDTACQLYNQRKRQWPTGRIRDGYQTYMIGGKMIKRGNALLHTFIGPPEDRSWTCQHNDGDRSNDHLYNIQWTHRSRDEGTHAPLVLVEGERWAELSGRRYISSFGRVAKITDAGELVEWYSAGKEDYLTIKSDGIAYPLHRLVVLRFGTEDERRRLPDGEVDHIDGDTRNNDIDNLQVLSIVDHRNKRVGERFYTCVDEGGEYISNEMLILARDTHRQDTLRVAQERKRAREERKRARKEPAGQPRKRVRLINRDTNDKTEFDTVLAASKKLQVSRSFVDDYISGKRRHGQYHVEFIKA